MSLELRRMIVEIHGVSTRNKGAELMLVTILDRLAKLERAVPVVDANFGSFEERAHYGLRLKLGLRKPGRSMLSTLLMPRSFRQTCGLVMDRETDAVIDASGFAFGDQLPPETAIWMAKNCRRWQQQGKPIVLLPQAFGPFRTSPARRAFKEILSSSTLIFARDQESLMYAREISDGQDEKLRVAPDVTIGFQPQATSEFNSINNCALIVPNARMLDSTTPSIAARYPQLLAVAIRTLEQRGLRAGVLIHDGGEDEKLVGPVFEQLGRQLEVFREDCPIRLKQLLAAARCVIGSRYHALVSALSSSTPSLAIGWSHKYPQLFEEFGCPDMVFDPLYDEKLLTQKIDRLVYELEIRKASLASRTGYLCQKVDAMWDSVIQIFSSQSYRI